MSNETDLDALLKALEKAESELEKEDTSKYTSKNKPHVKRFIDELGIKTGVEKISTSVIFFTYIMKWDGISREKKLKKIEFFRQFKKFFTPTRTGKQRFYLLDPEAFDVSREGLLEADHYNTKYDKMKRTNSEKKRKKEGKMGQSKEKQEPKT